MTRLVPGLQLLGPCCVLLALSGCGITREGNILRAAAVQRGATAADEALANAEWLLCRAATVGSVVRRYGASTVKADAWRAICRTDPVADVVGPAE